jgi:transcriptional regulator with XRE-family HTH domain
VAAGIKLKTLRNRCNITVRDVEQASRRIAEAKGDKRFRISNGWLAQLENGISEPSICKLFSLCATYRATFNELARLYNVDIDEIDKYICIANPQLTQLSPNADDAAHVTCDVLGTNLLPQLSAPANSGNHQQARNVLHGYIGLTDYTMYPLIRPGAVLEIDATQNKLHSIPWHNEFERPIFFIELRGGYACGWCELQGNQLLIIPYHLSSASVRSFTYPREAEIVGRVVGYKTRCVDAATEAAR